MKVLVLLLVLTNTVWAQKFPELAKTPPMGWNSWNKFECDGLNEKVVREVADAMVASGMKDAGYQYIVLDDCWQKGRDKHGNILADSTKFPSGIKALSDYVHSRGLKFGLYSCAGTKTCAGRPGSHGYEFQDALQYAAWDVDFLKYDWCNTDGQNAEESYRLMSKALRAAGRPVIFSLCEWGLSKPWLWAKDIGHLWRTTGDIKNNWDMVDAKEGRVWAGGVTVNLDMQQGLEKYAAPGGWNDPDMLEVGNGALTTEESRAHFSLWCMLAAPLITGNDLRTMDAETKKILTNRYAIAIDQDVNGVQGKKIIDEERFEVFVKPLTDERIAICFFNRDSKELRLNFDWKRLAMQTRYSAFDVWGERKFPDTTSPLQATIKAHDVLLLILSKK